MKEILDIIKAYEIAEAQNKQAALATVVHVEGSSYRRPGARMLITEDGLLTGAISGGCLEGDALRKALLVMQRQQPMLVTYDTNDEDDAKFGLGLGCNGVIQVLIEPIVPGDENNPVKFLQAIVSKRQKTVIVTLFSLLDKKDPQYGTCLLYADEGVIKNKPTGLEAQLEAYAKEALQKGETGFKNYIGSTHQVSAFVELIPPPVSLVIIGAGNDVMPLVEMADIIGWQTTVVDGRREYANKERFASCQVLVSKPTEVLDKISIDDRTVFLLMTHNYNYDLAILPVLLQRDLVYIGMLGPKKKKERMLSELAKKGIHFTNEQLAVLHSPVGLDIGAETPEEIALSIMAEIKAVLSGKQPASLKHHPDAIHARSELIIQPVHVVSNYKFSNSPPKFTITKIGLVILAAGGSFRLGHPKQLLPFKGKALLQHIIDEAEKAALGPVVVTLGGNAVDVLWEIDTEGINTLMNNDWEQGMSTSIKKSLTYLSERSPAIDAVLFITCDQPFVSAELLKAIVVKQLETGLPIVTSLYENTMGPPALFHKEVFNELMKLEGDKGARMIIQQQKENVAAVLFPEGAVDIDTAEDYERLLQTEKKNDYRQI